MSHPEEFAWVDKICAVVVGLPSSRSSSIFVQGRGWGTPSQGSGKSVTSWCWFSRRKSVRGKCGRKAGCESKPKGQKCNIWGNSINIKLRSLSKDGWSCRWLGRFDGFIEEFGAGEVKTRWQLWVHHMNWNAVELLGRIWIEWNRF